MPMLKSTMPRIRSLSNMNGMSWKKPSMIGLVVGEVA